jgi:hypothetical protein
MYGRDGGPSQSNRARGRQQSVAHGFLCESDYRPCRAPQPNYQMFVGDITSQPTILQMAMHVLRKAPARFCLAGFSLGSEVALKIMQLAGHRIDRLGLPDCFRPK